MIIQTQKSPVEILKERGAYARYPLGNGDALIKGSEEHIVSGFVFRGMIARGEVKRIGHLTWEWAK